MFIKTSLVMSWITFKGITALWPVHNLIPQKLAKSFVAHYALTWLVLNDDELSICNCTGNDNVGYYIKYLCNISWRTLVITVMQVLLNGLVWKSTTSFTNTHSTVLQVYTTLKKMPVLRRAIHLTLHLLIKLSIHLSSHSRYLQILNVKFTELIFR